jgi:hypothetical protein
MTTKGAVARVWKHFEPVLEENNSGTVDKSGYACQKCKTKVSLHPKEGYRHIKNCLVMTNEEKEAVITNLPAQEVEKYRKYWIPGMYFILSIIECIMHHFVKYFFLRIWKKTKN